MYCVRTLLHTHIVETGSLALQLKELIPKLHILKVLFRTNLVSNICNKALKKAPYLMPN